MFVRLIALKMKICLSKDRIVQVKNGSILSHFVNVNYAGYRHTVFRSTTIINLFHFAHNTISENTLENP